MAKQHYFELTVRWTGNLGEGTRQYHAYSRNHSIILEGKPEIAGSSDPVFRGDKSRHSPEDLFLSSLSSCHMLWYLHLCAQAGVVVTDYVDKARGLMQEDSDGGGRFVEVTLQPVVSIADQTMVETALSLHKRANELCFIANSVNFNVLHQATIRVREI